MRLDEPVNDLSLVARRAGGGRLAGFSLQVAARSQL